MATQSSPYAIASSKVGLNEAAPALRDFLYNGGQNLDPATRAWCADFVNASLRESGMKGTGSGMARSFLNYGQPVDQPQRGDIAVFTRGDPNGPSGHVGFFDGIDANGNVRVLGGNQGNSVSYASYPASRLLGYRRPGDAVTSDAPVQTAEAQPAPPPSEAMPYTNPNAAQPEPSPGLPSYSWSPQQSQGQASGGGGFDALASLQKEMQGLQPQAPPPLAPPPRRKQPLQVQPIQTLADLPGFSFLRGIA